MALLTAQHVNITGSAVTYSAAGATGDTLPPHRRGVFHVRNGSAAAVMLTVVVPGTTAYGQPQPDIALSVPAGAEAAVGPIEQGLADPANGTVQVTYSAVTSVTVAYVTI